MERILPENETEEEQVTEKQQHYLEAYLQSIALTRTMPCLAELGKIIVVGKPNRTLDQVMPYLATLPGVISYNPEACILTFRRQPGLLTLYRDKVYFIQVESVDRGLELLDALKEAINATWEHRHELVPTQERRRRPRPLDVWSLLPQTNCRLCGEMTCMAFAFALLQERQNLQACEPLQSDESFAARRDALVALI